MDNIIHPARNLDIRTPVDQRMRLYVKGQVTWPEPLLNETCATCVYFDSHNVSEGQIAKGMGRCRRAAEMHGGKWFKQLAGGSTACSEYGTKGGDK